VDKKVGTKTIHVNGLLRVFMYSKRFGAADLDASQGLERRMVHPTAATKSLAGRRPSATRIAIDRHRCKHRFSGLTRNGPSRRPVSVFCSRIPNFVELGSAEPHYSVIDRYAAVLLTSYIGWRPLNDEVANSRFEGACPLTAHGSSILCFYGKGFIRCERREF
jgi:hypothetical protein